MLFSVILGVSDMNANLLGGPDFPIQIKSIKISPDPPKPGEDLTVTAIGEANELVEVGVSHSP